MEAAFFGSPANAGLGNEGGKGVLGAKEEDDDEGGEGNDRGMGEEVGDVDEEISIQKKRPP